MKIKKPRAALVTKPKPLDLSLEEQRLIALYRATNDSRQHMVVVMAEIYVKHFPRHVRPTLRIVNGGAA